MDRFATTPYTLPSLFPIWNAEGVEIELVEDPRETAPADLAILHVDLTVVPTDYRTLAARYPRCLNRHTPDISKRMVSRHLVTRNDGYDGPVIVKSNFNSGGWMEAMKTGRGRQADGRRAVFEQYPIYDRVGLVPFDVWEDRDFVVERFLPEVERGRYCTRYWLFLGRSEIAYRIQADAPVVKSANTVSRERIDEIPEELRQMREEMGFDYGKFDFGIVDGKVVLYDANRTPGFGALTGPQAQERALTLAEGLWDFVGRAN